MEVAHGTPASSKFLLRVVVFAIHDNSHVVSRVTLDLSPQVHGSNGYKMLNDAKVEMALALLGDFKLPHASLIGPARTKGYKFKIARFKGVLGNVLFAVSDGNLERLDLTGLDLTAFKSLTLGSSNTHVKDSSNYITKNKHKELLP